jgi:hypothetical protein
MAQDRSCTLPGGMKELLDVIRSREDEDEAFRQQLRQLKMVMERDCEVNPVRILALLRQRIDQDLLFAEDFELVRPLVRKTASEIWSKAQHLTPLHIYSRTREKIIEISVEIIRELLGEIRGRYLEQRDSGRLDF